MPGTPEVSFDTPLSDIPPALRERCVAWMKEHATDAMSSFDIAVHCAHDLELVCAEDDWVIPYYLTDLSEELYPDGDPEPETQDTTRST